MTPVIIPPPNLETHPGEIIAALSVLRLFTVVVHPINKIFQLNSDECPPPRSRCTYYAIRPDLNVLRLRLNKALILVCLYPCFLTCSTCLNLIFFYVCWCTEREVRAIFSFKILYEQKAFNYQGRCLNLKTLS